MKKVWLIAVFALVATRAAADENCGPLRIVSQVDMLSTEGSLLIPVKVNGLSIKMIFDTGGWFQELSPKIAKTLGLPISKRGFEMIDVTGHTTDKTVTVADFEIGSVKANEVKFMVWADDNGDTDGVMGPRLVKLMDVDLDFAARKISFIMQDHCPGKVVYWKTPSYAIVPFTLTDEGHIRMPIELDGKRFTALLDTGADRSFITLRAADEAFGVTKTSPGVTEDGFVNGDKSVKQYRRTFKTLTVGGITFNNPTLDMIPDLMRNHLITSHAPPINSLIDTNNEAEGTDDVTVGLEELRHLHIYIAYKEQKLYISPASPASVESASTPPTRQTASP